MLKNPPEADGFDFRAPAVKGLGTPGPDRKKAKRRKAVKKKPAPLPPPVENDGFHWGS